MVLFGPNLCPGLSPREKSFFQQGEKDPRPSQKVVVQRIFDCSVILVISLCVWYSQVSIITDGREVAKLKATPEKSSCFGQAPSFSEKSVQLLLMMNATNDRRLWQQSSGERLC